MGFQNREHFGAWILGGILWVSTGSVASASTIEAGVQGVAAGCFASVGTSPASGSWTFSNSGFGASSASASASGGTLRGFSTASFKGNSITFSGTSGSCWAVDTSIDDVVMSGPGSTVSTHFSADLSGTISSS